MLAESPIAGITSRLFRVKKWNPIRFAFPSLLYLLCRAVAPVIADPALVQGWDGYRTILWMGDTAYQHPEKLPQFFDLAREMGINAITVHPGDDPKVALTNRLGFYVENVVNRGLCLKFNSNVKDWNKFVTDWASGGRPETALVRDYSLDDPQWSQWAAREVEQTVKRHGAAKPFAYDLRDELSITHSANPFDYDFSQVTLASFRQWLQAQYPSLTALNTAWETRFSSWEEVRPFTTDRIKNRMASGDALPRGNPDWQSVQKVRFSATVSAAALTAWNFSPWADFRTYMDLSLARALGGLRDAAHRSDPLASIGIEGTQMAHAFGGYDLWRLSQVLDWVEPYDIGDAREILGSFMPGKPFLTTVFEQDTQHASRRLWHLLLEGDRGCIVWWSEDRVKWRDNNFGLSDGARALAPVLKEMASPLGSLFLQAKPEYDPIYILYSQPSIQADWLLESTVDGSTWLRRFSSFESENNRLAKVRDGWLKLFQDLGFSPRFVSGEQLVRRDFPAGSAKAVILPQSLALSDKEVKAIKMLVDAPGSAGAAVFADGTPGLFDEHCRRRESSPLASSFPPALSAEVSRVARGGTETGKSWMGDMSQYPTRRLHGGGAEWVTWVRDTCPALTPMVSVSADSHTRIRRYRHGAMQLLAFERNVDYHMSEELKQAGGNESLESPVGVTARLPDSAHVYDLRRRQYLGRSNEIRFTLDPWQPSLFAVTSGQGEVEALFAEWAKSDSK